LSDEDKVSLVERLKKEIARLEWEEELLKKRDNRLKWEQEMIQMEEGLKIRGNRLIDDTPNKAFAAGDDGGPENPGGVDGPTQKSASSDVKLDAGSTYLILEEKPEKSVSLYLRELGAGLKGLYITRSNPRHVAKRVDLGDSRICWLTGVRSGDDITSISGLQELSILVSNHIDEHNASIILLDGVEYLISNNDFAIVLRLLQQIRDKVSTSESKLLIPLNSQALDSKQLTLLERECHRI
jgi:hypothetical protein